MKLMWYQLPTASINIQMQRNWGFLQGKQSCLGERCTRYIALKIKKFKKRRSPQSLFPTEFKSKYFLKIKNQTKYTYIITVMFKCSLFSLILNLKAIFQAAFRVAYYLVSAYNLKRDLSTFLLSSDLVNLNCIGFKLIVTLNEENILKWIILG